MDDRVVCIGNIILQRNDILRALSWYSLIPEDALDDSDKKAMDNLLRLINYLTRNGR